MRIGTLLKFGTIVSVFLFCIAVGYYAFTQLTVVDQNRNVDLFTLVPSDSKALLESENINEFLDEYTQLTYHAELKNIQFPELFSFLINQLNEYTTTNAHGLSNQMSHVLVSYHGSTPFHNQVIYFRKGFADEHILENMLRDFSPNHFTLKKESYRGENILIYPLGSKDFLSIYSGEGFFVVSYQKKLIEKVIDTYLDKTSIKEDKQFARLVEKRKTPHLLSLFMKNTSLPFLLDKGQVIWCEYDFHVSSDVLFVTGESIWPEDCTKEEIKASLLDIQTIAEPDAFVSANSDSIRYYMELAQENCEKKDYKVLYNECLAALSNETSFALVADMQKVFDERAVYYRYIPTFIMINEETFRHFVLSTQLTFVEDRPSCIWVLTYKR